MIKQSVLNIRPLRQQRGLTQVQLAERLNIEQSRVSAYETGRQAPPLHRIPAIAQALGVEVGDLFATIDNA